MPGAGMNDGAGRKCRLQDQRDKMAGLMKSLKRVFMSELLRVTALRIDEGRVRLSMRLKRDRITHEKFVVLGLVAAASYKHAELSADEFQQFLEAAKSMQRELHGPYAAPRLEG